MTDATQNIRFGADGLLSAAIQDSRSGDLLMVGFMNREALVATQSSGYVHFWSRSRERLWKKGETSGHVQRVEEIRINCEQNSLLIEVEQIGAVCHDGYDTCYYRRLEPNGDLTVVRDRRFDPRDVYHSQGDTSLGIAALSQRWWSTYAWLRDHDLGGVSSTSRRLHAPTNEHPARIAAELRELAGVLAGTHRHSGFREDIILEAGQVLYWCACAGIHEGITWEDVRPDLALSAQHEQGTDDRLLIRLLEARAALLEQDQASPEASLLHDTITIVATVVTAHDIQPELIIQNDLDEMSQKPYLSELVSTWS